MTFFVSVNNTIGNVQVNILLCPECDLIVRMEREMKSEMHCSLYGRFATTAAAIAHNMTSSKLLQRIETTPFSVAYLRYQRACAERGCVHNVSEPTFVHVVLKTASSCTGARSPPPAGLLRCA